MVTPDERKWMWEKYAPNPRMKLNLGIRRRLAPLVCTYLLCALLKKIPIDGQRPKKN